MADVSADSTDKGASRPPARRARTGCQRCRIRRRKCDEGKPACQRCLQAGFTCQYGVRLSFLAKNAKTVELNSEAASRVSFSFVGEKSPPAAPDPGLRDGEEVETGTHDASPGVGRYSAAESVPPSARDYLDFDAATALDGLLSLSSEEFSYSSSPTFILNAAVAAAAADRIAPTAHETPSLPASTPHLCEPEPTPSSCASHGRLTDTTDTTNTTDTTVATDTTRSLHPGDALQPEILPVADEEFPNCSHILPDRCIQLLRHFRYNLAPWLDMCDPNQTFGLVVFRMASKSRPVLEALLSFSLATLGLSRVSSVDLLPATIPPLPRMGTDSPLTLLERRIISCFHTLFLQMTAPAASWDIPVLELEPTELDFMNKFTSPAQEPSAILEVAFLTLRLQLGVSLLSDSPVSVPRLLSPFLPVSFPAPSPLAPSALDSSAAAFDFGKQPILLCTQAVNYCFGRDEAASTPKAIQWQALFDALTAWRESRPRRLQPVIELDDDDRQSDASDVLVSTHKEPKGQQQQQQQQQQPLLLPLVVFTNGAAALANQMYHTAALLLLLHRPRTIATAAARGKHRHSRKKHSPFLVSPLWHARRICGIALNSTGRGFWDFSLVAALFVAAKRMTYGPQQEAILQVLSRVQSMTKWNLDGLAEQLQKSWQSSC